MQIVVVSFDQLSTRFLGCYGCEWVETPHFDRIAAQGLVFDRCFANRLDPADSPHAWWTAQAAPTSAAPAPSTRSRLADAGVACRMLAEDEASIDLPPDASEWNIEVVSGAKGLSADPEDTPFAQLVDRILALIQQTAANDDSKRLYWLKARGIVGNELPPRDFAALYLDELEESEPHWDEPDLPDANVLESVETSDVDLAPEEVLALLERTEGKFIEQLDDADARRLRRLLYAGWVSYIDVQLGRLLHGIEAAGAAESTVLVVTAAQGSSPEQRLWPASTSGVTLERILAPLVIQGGQHGRNAHIWQCSDLPDILVAIARGDQDLPLLAASAAQAADPIRVVVGDNGTCAAISGHDCLIASDGAEQAPTLHNLEADPWFVQDLRSIEPDKAEQISKYLDALRS